jgi:hypothetical protein
VAAQIPDLLIHTGFYKVLINIGADQEQVNRRLPIILSEVSDKGQELLQKVVLLTPGNQNIRPLVNLENLSADSVTAMNSLLFSENSAILYHVQQNLETPILSLLQKLEGRGHLHHGDMHIFDEI